MSSRESRLAETFVALADTLVSDFDVADRGRIAESDLDYPQFPPFTVSVQLAGDTAIATLSGELDLATAAILSRHLEPFKSQVKRVVYELANLSFLDAYGLRTLQSVVSGDPALPNWGVSIRNPSRAVRRVLEILQFDSMIDHSSADPSGDKDT